jgi:hypothetical protein
VAGKPRNEKNGNPPHDTTKLNSGVPQIEGYLANIGSNPIALERVACPSIAPCSPLRFYEVDGPIE